MIIAQFYLDIMARLLDNIKEPDGTSSIRHFDLWNNQTSQENEEEELPFPLPAVFLEYDPLEFQTLGNRKQATNGSFSLHICSEVIAEHTSRETPDIRNGALDHLKLCDNIFFWLQNFSSEYFNAIMRTGFRTDHNHGSVYEHVMTFSTRINDVAAMHPRVLVTPDPVITGSLT